VIAFPGSWSLEPLMDVVDLHDSRRIPLNQNERALRPGKYPYYGANGQVDSIDGFIFDGEYVLLAEDGGYFDNPARGVAYEVSGQFWVNNHAHILSPKEGLSRRFLTYALNAVDWMEFVGGSTRLKLTQEGMRRVHIPLPSPSQQHRIVSKLDSVFAKLKAAREELDRVPKLVERYKQAVLQRCFDGATSEVALGDLISDGPQNGLYLPQTAYGSGIPILRIEDFGFDEARSIKEWKRVRLPLDQSGRYDLTEGDIVINRVNSPSHLGKSLLVGKKHLPAVFESNMMKIHLKTEVMPAYVQAFLSCDYGRRRLTRNAKWAVNQASINQGDVLAVQIPMLDKSEQLLVIKKIECLVERVTSMLRNHSAAEHLVDRLDQAILRRTFAAR
jgi:type I restriction enzyme S subunit